MSQTHTTPRQTKTKLTAAVGILTMLFGALLVFAPGAGADGPVNVFQGVCTPTDASSGTCVVDEPMGENVATHGTATYSRSGDDMTFTITLSDVGASISQIQACMTVVASGSTNPYVPTVANTCAGNTPDRVLDVSGVGVQNPFTIDLTTVPDFESGDHVYFALHINTGGRTTYIVGSGGLPEDVCLDMQGVQTSTSECPEDVCLDMQGVQTSTSECPEDVCLDMQGVQTSTSECPEDVCLDMQGVQTSTTECPEDVCLDMQGVQTSTTECPPPPTCVELGNCPAPVVEPEPAELTIVKVVMNGPDEWSAPFSGDLGTFDLTHLDGDRSFEELDADAYEVTEADSGNATLASIVCDEDADVTVDLDSATVTVDLAAGDDVTCTFTNVYDVDVLPESPPIAETPPVKTPVVPAPAAVTPKATPKAEVLGATVTRTLPRTGSSSTGTLALAGGALMLLGAALVGGSRRLQTVG